MLTHSFTTTKSKKAPKKKFKKIFSLGLKYIGFTPIYNTSKVKHLLENGGEADVSGRDGSRTTQTKSGKEAAENSRRNIL